MSDSRTDRARLIRASLAAAQERPDIADYLVDFLKQPLKDPAGDPFLGIVKKGTYDPLPLMKRDFLCIEDARHHYGLFDPLGHLHEKPFLVSDNSW